MSYISGTLLRTEKKTYMGTCTKLRLQQSVHRMRRWRTPPWAEVCMNYLEAVGLYACLIELRPLTMTCVCCMSSVLWRHFPTKYIIIFLPVATQTLLNFPKKLQESSHASTSAFTFPMLLMVRQNESHIPRFYVLLEVWELHCVPSSSYNTSLFKLPANSVRSARIWPSKWIWK